MLKYFSTSKPFLRTSVTSHEGFKPSLYLKKKKSFCIHPTFPSIVFSSSALEQLIPMLLLLKAVCVDRFHCTPPFLFAPCLTLASADSLRHSASPIRMPALDWSDVLTFCFSCFVCSLHFFFREIVFQLTPSQLTSLLSSSHVSLFVQPFWQLSSWTLSLPGCAGIFFFPASRFPVSEECFFSICCLLHTNKRVRSAVLDLPSQTRVVGAVDFVWCCGSEARKL